MENKDWQRVEDLFHAAFGLTAEERTVYLTQACSDDASLRAEVESLIAAFDQRREFLDQPAFGLGMRVLSGGSNRETLDGKSIGPYKILTLLGKGGMGEVYLAEDSRLDRKVALKFLSDKFVDDAWARRRLMKEAQAVAKLDHPNICAVYGFEEYDGYNFMVLQYIEGETLASLIHKRLIEPGRTSSLALQIVSALAEAHSHGIIHRDIKPQNIIVTTGGQVKVLDFGLAKFVQQKPSILLAEDSSHSSQLGMVIGTVAYMSPEQLKAERLDFRSDIFSFGIVLYEMISGRNPYWRPSNAEIITAILTADPEPPASLTKGMPAGLARIAQKCLKRDREDRYQSASELLIDLDNIPGEMTSRRLRLPDLSLRAYAMIVFLLLFIVGASFIYSRLTRVQTLAVLPVSNESADAATEYLSEGLTESLINRLSRLSRLRVKSPSLVSVYKGQRVDPQKAGRDLNVDAVLVGAITRRGESLILQTNLISTADGSQIWGEEYSMKPTEMLTLQEDLSGKIASNLQLSLSGGEKKYLAASETDNDEAFKHYLLGRHFWKKRDKENIQTAIGHFEQAIDLDPVYARAHAGLADCYVLLSTVAYGSLSTKEAMSKAKSAAKTALEIDDTLCEAHTSLGVVILKYDWNWQEAEREFKRAISLKSDYAPAHYWYSNLLALTGRLSESITESEAAKELDPFSSPSDLNLGRAFYYARQYDRAADCLRKALDENPDNSNLRYVLGYVYVQKGQWQESIDLFQNLYSKDKRLAAAPLGYVYARMGRRDEAMEILDELEELSKQNRVPAQEKALIYVGLDDKDQAFRLLMEACNDHFASFPLLIIDPLLDGIRSDPRFVDLARCARITQ